MIKDAFKKQNTKCCTGNQGFIQQRAPNKKITLELWQDPSPLPFGQSPNSIKILVEKPSPHKLRKESVVKQSKFRMHTKGDTGENGNSFYNSQVATLVRMNTRRILIKLEHQYYQLCLIPSPSTLNSNQLSSAQSIIRLQPLRSSE